MTYEERVNERIRAIGEAVRSIAGDFLFGRLQSVGSTLAGYHLADVTETERTYWVNDLHDSEGPPGACLNCEQPLLDDPRSEYADVEEGYGYRITCQKCQAVTSAYPRSWSVVVDVPISDEPK